MRPFIWANTSKGGDSAPDPSIDLAAFQQAGGDDVLGAGLELNAVSR